MIVEENDYLEHHGVKGMHWGVRNDGKKARNGTTKLSKRGKLAVVGGYYAGNAAAGLVLGAVGVSPVGIIIGGTAAGIAGGSYVAKRLKAHGHTPVKDIKNLKQDPRFTRNTPKQAKATA